MARHNLVLTGFMGTGKTTIGRAVAERLGMAFVDMDQLIVERMGKTIPEIFGQLGESAFRALERALCLELSQQGDLVIATGGGALIDEMNCRSLSSSGMIVCLDCSAKEIVHRIGADPNRPMLQGGAPEKRVESLLQQRRAAYRRIPYHIDTTHLPPEAVITAVESLYAAQPVPLAVETPQGPYRVHLYPGGAAHLGALILGELEPSSIVVIADGVVWKEHGTTISSGLDACGISWSVLTVPPGEEHKQLDTVRGLYDQMLAVGLDRSGLVVAVGGGVTTDMAGFAAATYMRGVALAQVPTSLLAMIDASVGGKVAVDLPQGKNLVGAFKQPALVLLDPSFLNTLPDKDFLSGLAEIIKHGIIADSELFAALEAGHDHIDIRWLLQRALQVKIDIVQRDPFERGERALLNLGHTFGHAFEVLGEYQLAHGLAVSQGLVVAAELSARMALCSREVPDRIVAALRANGLPTRHALPGEAVLQAMQSDKKRQGHRMRLVLIEAIGQATVRDDVPEGLLRDSLEACQ